MAPLYFLNVEVSDANAVSLKSATRGLENHSSVSELRGRVSPQVSSPVHPLRFFDRDNQLSQDHGSQSERLRLLAIVGKVISPTKNYGNFPGVFYAISIVKRSA